MSEQHVDEFLGGGYSQSNFTALRALNGVYFPSWGAYPGTIEWIRMIHSIERATAGVIGGRIYHDSTDDDNEFSITSLTFIYRGEVISVAGSVNNALSSGDDDYYVYATPAGSIVASTTGWPTTPHVRIGVITLSSGAWDWSGFVDHRATQSAGVVAEPVGGLTLVQDKASDFNVDDSDNQAVFTNTGATGQVTATLPAASAGLAFEFVVTVAQNLVVQAATGDTIRVAGSVSTAGGTATANTIGHTLRLVAVDGTQWIATAVNGTWTLSS